MIAGWFRFHSPTLLDLRQPSATPTSPSVEARPLVPAAAPSNSRRKPDRTARDGHEVKMDQPRLPSKLKVNPPHALRLTPLSSRRLTSFVSPFSDSTGTRADAVAPQEAPPRPARTSFLSQTNSSNGSRTMSRRTEVDKRRTSASLRGASPTSRPSSGHRSTFRQTPTSKAPSAPS